MLRHRRKRKTQRTEEWRETVQEEVAEISIAAQQQQQ
jgi:hypothetical protein